MDATDTLVEVLRSEGLRVLATLARTIGDLAVAEDALSEATITALDAWPKTGIPDNPRAWLAVVARSSAVDHARRRRQATTPIDDVPEASLGVEDRHVEKLKIPQGLLTERQILILKCLYDEERDVAEVAQLLKIDAQTVRSTHHKALLRLRAHFNEETS